MSTTIENGMVKIEDALIDVNAIGTLETKANVVAAVIAAVCVIAVPIRLFAARPEDTFNPAVTFLLFLVGVAAVVWFNLSWKLVVGANNKTFQLVGSKIKLEQVRSAIAEAKRRRR